MSVNVIRFVSDNDYSASEVEMLKTAFTDFITELDADAKRKSIEVRTMTEDEAKAEEFEAVQEFLNNSQITARLVVAHPDHDKAVEVEFTEEV